MADDRATDIVHELDEEERARLIPLLVPMPARPSRAARYPPNTAGALMTTEYVAVPASWTVVADPAAHPPGRAHPRDGVRDLRWTRPASSCR
jgi:hypothetical protein